MDPRLARLVVAAALVALSGCQPAARAAAQAAEPAPPAAPPATPAAPPATPDVPAKPSTAPRGIPNPAPEIEPAPGDAVVAVGQAVPFAGGRLHLVRVANDSRCPKDAQCIWEGEVTLDFVFTGERGTQAFQLARRSHPTAGAGDHTFSLAGFGPCAASKDLEAECATVTASAADTR